MSYSFTQSQTFTVTHAKHLASKVAADLKRLQRFYGSPNDDQIAKYEQEVTELLKAGFLDTVTYGFQRNENWIEPALRYTADELTNDNSNDDDPGSIKPNASIEGASFASYLTYSQKYKLASEEEKKKFQSALPFQRTGAEEPGISGYLSQDKTYTSGGKSINRSTIKNY